MWSDRALQSITLADLETLLTDKVRENRQLDYKDEAPAHPSQNDDKKSEFLVDVSALANGSGGLLIYGIAEKKEDNVPIPRCRTVGRRREDVPGAGYTQLVASRRSSVVSAL